MREEKREEILDSDLENAENEVWPGKPNRRPMYIALSVVGVVVLGALMIVIFRGGEEGTVVPPPRTVTFGDNGTQQNGETTVEQTVTIAPDQLEKIGLTIGTVGETLSTEAVSVASAGVVQPNAYRETPVMSLLGGVVRAVNAELGQNVGKGRSLAVIFSDELAAAQSRYLALQTEAQTARQNYDRAARLVRISPVSNTELDEALARMKTTRAELEENRKRYDRTVKLLEIGAVSREELEQATSKFRASDASVEEAKKKYERAVQVAQINPVSRGEFEQAAVKRQTAESELATARQRLLLYGLQPQRVNSLRSPAQITSEISVPAPVSGTITRRDVNVGQVVDANKELMRVTDLGTVWVIAQVYEKDVQFLREGSGASVTTDSYPGRVFRGHVTYVDPNISPETRTAQVRVEMENPGQVLKIGMYVNVAFGSMGFAERTMPMVPASAVQNINERQIVFAATENAGVFIARPVRLGKENNGQFIVSEGLNVGDRIVTEGSFLLRAELLKQDPMRQ